jgi:hypothetical protein
MRRRIDAAARRQAFGITAAVRLLAIGPAAIDRAEIRFADFGNGQNRT